MREPSFLPPSFRPAFFQARMRLGLLKSPQQWGKQGAERCGRLRRRDEGGADEGVRCKKRKK